MTAKRRIKNKSKTAPISEITIKVLRNNASTYTYTGDDLIVLVGALVVTAYDLLSRTVVQRNESELP